MSARTPGDARRRPRRRTDAPRAGAPTGGPARFPRVVAALVVVLAVLGWWGGPADAHAELETTTPADQSVVATSPKELVLRFSEGVSVRPDGVRLLAGDGTRMELGKARARDSTVTVPVDGTLPKGGYVVAWRVVSADGHPVRGSFQFSVGARTTLQTGLADRAFAGSADRRDEIVGAVLRGLAALGTLAAAGAVLVGGLLRRDREPTPVTRLVAVLAGVGAVAVVAQLPLMASLATGRGWGSISDAGVLGTVLGDGVGWSIGLTVVGLVAVLVTTGLPFRGVVRAVAVGGAAIAPVGFVVTGHTRTMDPRWVGYTADAVHVVAGALWLGGLGALIAISRRRRAADDLGGAADAVARFSGLAGVNILALVAAGTALGAIEAGGLHGLTTTTYGRLLMAKVALVAVVLAMAAWNRFSFVPAVTGAPSPGRSASVDAADLRASGSEVEEPGAGALADPDPADPPGGDEPAAPAGAVDSSAWRRFDRVLRAEVLGIVAVLAVTGVLINVTPGKTAASSGPVFVSAPLGDGRIDVTIDPATVGRNLVHVYLFDADGRLDDRYDNADFELALPAQDIGPLARDPVRAGPGHFQLVGVDLAPAGEWTLTVSVRPDRFTVEKATVTFRVR